MEGDQRSGGCLENTPTIDFTLSWGMRLVTAISEGHYSLLLGWSAQKSSHGPLISGGDVPTNEQGSEHFWADTAAPNRLSALRTHVKTGAPDVAVTLVTGEG